MEEIYNGKYDLWVSLIISEKNLWISLIISKKHILSLPTNEKFLHRFLEAKTLNNHIYVKKIKYFYFSSGCYFLPLVRRKVGQIKATTWYHRLGDLALFCMQSRAKCWYFSFLVCSLLKKNWQFGGKKWFLASYLCCKAILHLIKMCI